ncbi:MAG TPA: PfkB family carbohydrate kinase [Vicinamibacterales bacterium]|nr:PfkB family carbohydrate kinase [Vicinamibacterales bacterium]
MAPDARTAPSGTAGRPLVFGEVLFDLFPDGTHVLGGAPFNVAWHLEGFGFGPLLISAVGDDAEGRDVLGQMAAWGLDSSGVQVVDRRPTGRVVVLPGPDENRFEITPDQAWDAIGTRAASAVVTSRPPLAFHGTLALRSDESWRTLRRLTREPLPTFVDLNLRDPWTAADRVRWCLSTARWLKLNDHELGRLTGAATATGDDCEAAARRLAETHALHQVIVTRGAAGAIGVADGDPAVRVATPVVADMVDTVGAGDAFSGVVVAGLIGAWPMDVTLARAAAFAADICRVQGATTADVDLYGRHLEAWARETTSPAVGRRDGLYVLSLSLHGLVRGSAIELGRDADTGGQVSYAVDQARALSARPDVARVDLVTRLVEDRRVDPSYARPFEPLGPGAQIVRLPFGPARYLKKESLWPHLDELVDRLTRHVRRVGRVPDVVHGHYADAGLVGAELAKVLGVPFFFTGHSLGRVKRARLLAAGKDAASIDDRYHIRTRIEAEERALETASVVITSTQQEIEEQYQAYDMYEPEHMRVIPPGVDLGRFSPPDAAWPEPALAVDLARFLADPDKPMILAIARADERKNFEGLVEAYALSEGLRARANLVLVVGTRDDIDQMPSQARTVLTRLLLLIDRHDLYGSVAYPKAHDPEDVPEFYRLAARSRGLFVNPALTEPFGLTLLEAAASGLPVVATNDGGPRDILRVCRNGLLVDATDPVAISRGLEEALASDATWQAWAASGVAGVHEHFSWSSHARRYVSELQRVLATSRPVHAPRASRLPAIDRLLVVDLDDVLSGDDDARRALVARLAEAGDRVGLCVATGLGFDETVRRLAVLDVRTPDVLITSTGTELHYGPQHAADQSWTRQIRERWDRDAVAASLVGLAGLTPGAADDARPFRLRYERDGDYRRYARRRHSGPRLPGSRAPLPVLQVGPAALAAARRRRLRARHGHAHGRDPGRGGRPSRARPRGPSRPATRVLRLAPACLGRARGPRSLRFPGRHRARCGGSPCLRNFSR